MFAKFAIIISFCLATSAHAGAWSREKGELFIAAGGNFLLSEGARLPVHYDPTLYAEYGASERVTLGLDIHTADAGRIGTAFFFASFRLVTLLRETNLQPILLSVRALMQHIQPRHCCGAACHGGADWRTDG